MKTIIEPFRIKMVEPIRLTSKSERRQAIAAANYNLFKLGSEDVLIDLLTDSGTSAMSDAQWAGVLNGDESYAGSRSWQRFERAIQTLTGYKIVIPTHQGRAAERILFSLVCGPGKIVPNNTHFDTTRANIEATGAEAVDLLLPVGRDATSEAPFKGDMDVAALESLLERVGPSRVPLVMITVTNNSCGGQPVSLANLRAVRNVCDQFQVPLYLDACRFAENAYLVKLREPGQSNRSAKDIAREMFRLTDGCTMSAKKDAFANIGGFLCTNDALLADREKELLILTEGFPTYGGLAGRDLEAIAIGLEEVLNEDYLQYRMASIAYLARHLDAAGVPLVRPPGGHAVYIDAARFAPHIAAHEYPGQAIAVALYEEGGIRSCEIGTAMFGRADPQGGADHPAAMELVRLAIPRRVYTQSHIDYVAEVVTEVFKQRERLRGYRITKGRQVLRHFTAHYAPLAP